jgi:serralysin
LLPDGKYIVSSGTYIKRYLPDGRIDTQFGDGGRVSKDRDHNLPPVTLVQSDGKIVYLDHLSDSLIRLHADGGRDPSFGTEGSVHIPALLSVFLDGDKILAIFGPAWLSETRHILRLGKDGGRDASFGSDGQALLEHPDYDEFLFRSQLLPTGDGSILLQASRRRGDREVPVLLRIDGTGSLDHSFGHLGAVEVTLRGHDR